MEKFEGFCKVGINQNEKGLAWEQKRKEVDAITDITGRGIDEGIKETVTAFEVNDLPTHNSCEGHIDHGFPYPFVEVTAGEEPRWKYEGQEELFKRVAEEKGISLEKIERESPEWDVNSYEEVENETGKRLNLKDEEEIEMEDEQENEEEDDE